MSHIETLGQLADARAEIARLTAELAAARAELDSIAEAGIKRGRSWEATEWEAAFGVRTRREAVAKLHAAEDALAAARAVPADVERRVECASNICAHCKAVADLRGELDRLTAAAYHPHTESEP